MQFDTSTKIQILWCFFIAEVKEVSGVTGADEPNVLWLETKTESDDGFDTHNYAFEVAFDECTQLYIQWCIYIHWVEFHLSQLSCHDTARAVASRQKGLWGWNGYAQTCNKANFRKHNTRGCQVTSLFHSIMIFTMKLGQKSQNPRNFCFTVFHIVPDLRKMNFYHKFTRIYHLSWSVARFASFSDV